MTDDKEYGLSHEKDLIIKVRGALEKIVAQGNIGTVSLERCIQYLKSVEYSMDSRVRAIAHIKRAVELLDDRIGKRPHWFVPERMSAEEIEQFQRHGTVPTRFEGLPDMTERPEH